MQPKDKTHGRFVSVPLSIRLYEGIDRSDPNACWNWAKKDRVKGGYGRIRGSDRKNQLAHRLSFQLANGSIRSDMDICHRCDNPACINPRHLFQATAKENIQDCISKGRRHVATIGRQSNGDTL